jgi:hypothetical protein
LLRSLCSAFRVHLALSAGKRGPANSGRWPCSLGTPGTWRRRVHKSRFLRSTHVHSYHRCVAACARACCSLRSPCTGCVVGHGGKCSPLHTPYSHRDTAIPRYRPDRWQILFKPKSRIFAEAGVRHKSECERRRNQYLHPGCLRGAANIPSFRTAHSSELGVPAQRE